MKLLEQNSYNPTPSEKSKKIAAPLINEIQIANSSGSLFRIKFPEQKDLPSIADWQQMLEEYTDNINLFNKKDIERFIYEETTNSASMKVRYKPEEEYILTFIPFTKNGYPLSESLLDDNFHIKSLKINAETDSVTGLENKPSFVHKFLPSVLQTVRFKVPKYQNENAFQRTATDIENLANAMRAAFQDLENKLKQKSPTI